MNGGGDDENDDDDGSIEGVCFISDEDMRSLISSRDIVAIIVGYTPDVGFAGFCEEDMVEDMDDDDGDDDDDDSGGGGSGAALVLDDNMRSCISF